MSLAERMEREIARAAKRQRIDPVLVAPPSPPKQLIPQSATVSLPRF